MLSAASSWLISSIFTLYFRICSLMSISTQLRGRGLSDRPRDGQHQGLASREALAGDRGPGQRPRDQAGSQTQLWAVAPIPVAVHYVTLCSSLHLSELEALSQQASWFEGGRAAPRIKVNQSLTAPCRVGITPQHTEV